MDLTMLYVPKEWAVCEVDIGEYQELRFILGPTEFKSCGSDSCLAMEYFTRRGSVEGLFFFDTEQIFMNLDKVYGEMALGRLEREWRGHPVGSLVFIVAKGVDEGKFTVGVEKKS